ncbi:MAG TPA: trypsin-like peptidase domain-containing protein [Terriglobia bacterium]|nr:trypsin-like peptidase domain-containing protein [Terriglobia bacterium]
MKNAIAGMGRKSPAAMLLVLTWMLMLAQAAAPSQNQESSVTTVVKSSVDRVVLVVVSRAQGGELGQGSGFIVSPDGIILTNYHVIEGASSAVVKLSNGAIFDVQGTLGVDDQGDLALLKVAGKNLPPIALGDSDSVSVGDRLIAIGSPLGLESTVADGIVSAIREESSGRKWIQTTVPASPGNSGGPLISMQGEAIGVVTFKASGGENLNFAVPINYAKELIASAGPLTSLGATQGFRAASKPTGAEAPIQPPARGHFGISQFYVVHIHAEGKTCHGEMSLGNGRIKFSSDNAKHSFDVPLADIKEVAKIYPWSDTLRIRLRHGRTYEFEVTDRLGYRQGADPLLDAILSAMGK